MKNLFRNLLLITSVFSMVFLFSCGDDDEIVDPVALAAPSIQITGSTGTSFDDATALVADGVVIAGDSVFYSVSVTAAGGFNTLRLSGGATGEVTRTTLGIDKGTTSTGTLVFGVKTLDTQLGDLVTVTFTAADDQEPSLSSEETFSFTVVSPGIVSHTETMLFGQSSSGGGSFYNAVDNAVFTVNEAFNATNQEKVDFVFWYGGTSGYAIGSVVDTDAITAFNEATNSVNLENLTTTNETKFKELSTSIADFDAIDNESELLNTFGEVAATATKVGGLSSTDQSSIFGFVTDTDRGTKVGLVKVIETAGTDGSNRAITIEVKIQE
jgi:hypothetical protein